MGLLILPSTNTSMGHLPKVFCIALYRLDFPQLKYVAGRFILLVGKMIILRLVVDLLGMAVGPLVSFLHTM